MPDYLVCDERDVPTQECVPDHVMEAFSTETDRNAFYAALKAHRGLSWALFRANGKWVAQHIEGEKVGDEAPMRHPG